MLMAHFLSLDINGTDYLIQPRTSEFQTPAVLHQIMMVINNQVEFVSGEVARCGDDLCAVADSLATLNGRSISTADTLQPISGQYLLIGGQLRVGITYSLIGCFV